MIKKILVGFGGLVLALLILPIFLSSHFSMARSIEIQAPAETIITKLADLNEYNKWNPFPEGDPTNQTSVSGLGVGSTLTWKGDNTGEGKMTIVEVVPGRKVAVQMEFYKPMAGSGLVNWTVDPKSESKTEMTWTFDQDLTYFNRYFGLVMDSMMGNHFEKGLKNFKQLVESN